MSDYLDMLAKSMGELAAHQAHVERAIEQAIPRYGTVTFLANEVDSAPAPPNPLALQHAKPIPPGDWRTVMLVASYNLNGNLPQFLLLDTDVYAPINAISPVIFPVYTSYKSCALATGAPSAMQGMFTLIFSNRELYVRT